MTRSSVIIVLGLLLLWPAKVVAGPAEDAGALIDRWVTAFNANDAGAVLGLYTPDALLHGTSSPKLNAGTDAIRDYFKGLPGSGNSVAIGERHFIVLDDRAVVAVGFYQFNRIQDGKPAPRPARFTFVLVKRGSDWLINHHHSSALPAAPTQ